MYSAAGLTSLLLARCQSCGAGAQDYKSCGAWGSLGDYKSCGAWFVSRIGQTVDTKFHQQKDFLASKSDIADVKQEVSNIKADLIKWMFIFWIGQINKSIPHIIFRFSNDDNLKYHFNIS